jgi:hypothetical protein
METQSQTPHPSAASLLRDDQDAREDVAYFRKLGIPYEPKSLIEVLTRHKPKSAIADRVPQSRRHARQRGDPGLEELGRLSDS